jgi:hypothetical protein
MKGREVFVSQMIAPDDLRGVKSILRAICTSVGFTTELTDGTDLRIVSRTELPNRSFPLPRPDLLSLTPCCLRQLSSRKLDPFMAPTTFSKAFVNLFLYQKTLSLVFLSDDDQARLSGYIFQMGGQIRPDGTSDFVISGRAMELESTSLVVRPSWIDALYSTDSYLNPNKFSYSTKPIAHAHVSFTQRTSSKPRIGHLKLVSEHQSQKPPPEPRRSISAKLRGKVEDIHSLDQFFTPKSQIYSTQRTQAVPDDADDVIEIFDLEKELPAKPVKAAQVEPPPKEKVPLTKSETPPEIGFPRPAIQRAKSTGSVRSWGDETRSLAEELTKFSQVEEPQKEVVFNIVYGGEKVGRPMVNANGRDPLFDLFNES